MSKWLFWPTPSAVYTANPVNFDGTNDYLVRGAGLTGAADSKIYTGSVWVRRGGVDALRRILHAHDNVCINVSTSATNDIRVNAGDASIRVRISFPVPTANTAWHHLLWSFDTADIATRRGYCDDITTGISWVNWTTDAVLDFTHTNWGIGGEANGNLKLTGDIADLQIWFGTYVDLSVEANRRLFITAGGKPVDPAIAEAALGEPIIQMTGATADWHTNKGSGGGFTENGAIVDGSGPVQL